MKYDDVPIYAGFFWPIKAVPMSRFSRVTLRDGSRNSEHIYMSIHAGIPGNALHIHFPLRSQVQKLSESWVLRPAHALPPLHISPRQIELVPSRIPTPDPIKSNLANLVDISQLTNDLPPVTSAHASSSSTGRRETLSLAW